MTLAALRPMVAERIDGRAIAARLDAGIVLGAIDPGKDVDGFHRST